MKCPVCSTQINAKALDCANCGSKRNAHRPISRPGQSPSTARVVHRESMPKLALRDAFERARFGRVLEERR